MVPKREGAGACIEVCSCMTQSGECELPNRWKRRDQARSKLPSDWGRTSWQPPALRTLVTMETDRTALHVRLSSSPLPNHREDCHHGQTTVTQSAQHCRFCAAWESTARLHATADVSSCGILCSPLFSCQGWKPGLVHADRCSTMEPHPSPPFILVVVTHTCSQHPVKLAVTICFGWKVFGTETPLVSGLARSPWESPQSL